VFLGHDSFKNIEDPYYEVAIKVYEGGDSSLKLAQAIATEISIMR
jgi:hypothetical protein